MTHRSITIFQNRESLTALRREAAPFHPSGDHEFGVDSDRTFTVSIHQGGQLVGGAVCVINLNWMYVETLWVDESMRGQGTGKLIMRAAESFAASLGVIGCWLYTTEFQAGSFYEKIGYKRIASIPERPASHTTIYYARTPLIQNPIPPGITIESPATEATTAALDDELIAHADQFVPIEAAEYTFMLRDEAGTLQGGLFGHTLWGWFDVHLMWSRHPDDMPHLLTHLETHCRALELTGITTQAFDERARAALVHEGYMSAAELPHRPPGHTAMLMIKHL